MGFEIYNLQLCQRDILIVDNFSFLFWQYIDFYGLQ